MARTAHETAYKAIRPKVLERDGNCCVKCGSSVGLEVHHIEGYKNNEIDKLATLCYLCHNIAPMGKFEFTRWLSIGEPGIELVERKFSQNGVDGLSRPIIWKILQSLIELGVETTKLKMKVGRDRVRKSGLRCEGQLPYGHKKGEESVLERMCKLRKSGMTFDGIADVLNADGILTRKGKSWMGCTIAKIVKRENIKKPKKVKVTVKNKMPEDFMDHIIPSRYSAEQMEAFKQMLSGGQ